MARNGRKMASLIVTTHLDESAFSLTFPHLKNYFQCYIKIMGLVANKRKPIMLHYTCLKTMGRE
jgi:hypothetical protein